MSQEEQGKKTSQVISDAAVKEVIPAKPTALSDEDLDNVAGGIAVPVCGDVVVENDETFSLNAKRAPKRK